MICSKGNSVNEKRARARWLETGYASFAEPSDLHLTATQKDCASAGSGAQTAQTSKSKTLMGSQLFGPMDMCGTRKRRRNDEL